MMTETKTPELRQWLEMQIEGIQRSSLTDASNGALKAFVQVLQRLDSESTELAAAKARAELAERRLAIAVEALGWYAKAYSAEMTSRQAKAALKDISAVEEGEQVEPTNRLKNAAQFIAHSGHFAPKQGFTDEDWVSIRNVVADALEVIPGA